MDTFELDGEPARIVFGSGTLGRVASELERLGASRALVLSTPGRADLADRVVAVLGEAVVGTFAGAVMHTPVEVTEEALSQARAVSADSIVSVGGGSTTGLGKALAVRTGLPHVVLPTTYSGSEVTSMLGETAEGEKVTRRAPEILPDVVIYDVDLTLTLPWQVTLTSGINAMAHAVEALYADDRTARTEQQATDAITSITSGLHDLHQDADSTDARSDLLYGAYLGGTCLGGVEMGLHHKLCHTLGGSFALAHAPTHTVVLPYAMAFNQPAAEAAMATTAKALGVDDAASGLQALVASWGGPTSLGDLGFRTSDVPRAAELTTKRPFANPREVRYDDLVALLTSATDGTRIGANR
jgi:alcohol dehydrogenase class IV